MKFVNKLTNIGGSLQTPIAILPAAGILLALGTIFTSQSFLDMMPIMDNPTLTHIFNVCLQCGSIIFGNLPLIFAAGVAIGLTNNDGVAALSAIVGYLIMNVTIGGILNVTPEMLETSRAYTSILGIPTLQTGVLGGIFIGVLASAIYNKFYKVELPQALAFFAGKRSVPIITAFAAFFLGIVMCFVWPPIQDGINALSATISNMNSAAAGFMFGFVERLTIPFGMNHVWWPTFWLQAGEYVNQAGQVVNGDQLIFFAQLADNVPLTAGTFMNGLFVLKMFSMPAAAFAMYKCARPENRKKVAGIMLSGAITSFVCGITEPLEFCFIFAAPVLFLIHAVIAGLGFAAMNLLGAHLGLSFSGGFLDYLFFNVLTNRSNWWIVIPVGIALFAIYYFLFTFAIKKWNLKTPGREAKKETDVDDVAISDTELITKVIEALGGSSNIVHVNACYSRLRVDVHEVSKVDKDAFTNLQASGVSILGKNIQVIYGMKAVAMKEGVLAMLKGATITGESISSVQGDINISEDPKALERLVSPYNGTIMPITAVPDEVFKSKAMGDGFAVDLNNGEITSPINGTVISIFPTKHAISLVDTKKNEVLLHLGLDTVNLNGEGFTLHVEAGDSVSAGQKLADVDLKLLKEKQISAISPVIFTNLDSSKYEIKIKTNGSVAKGQKSLFEIVKK
ncbi:PTS system glucose-specific transporter subunit IICBA [[Clostridium] innocuum]|uniref:PTS system glucose-specific transporter subunit IICBA n=2 Tax=Clostridium innocuum TaxID=1522 RepID=A0A099I8C6_CLOIN|nr:glucose-specific PTS transporter subunit IIBC [[Clostridium] innocuum]KGJ54234.1 PTS system glucose-specific transporter subunit IICBA [[Clostridium] innocuum]